MNQNLKNHYQNIVSYDLITKFHFTNIFHILKIEKICLNIGFEENLFDKQKIINILLFLKLITNQIPFQKPKISLHIKKNTITGCQITLRKKNIYHFLEKILLFKNLENIIHLNKINQKILNFTIQDSLNFYELKSEFLKFRNIPNIDVSIHSNSISNQHLFLFLNYLYLIQR